ncbi:MAG: DMT family transporter [Butyrivibrio sp.]
MRKNSIKGMIILLIGAAIWGFAFVAQSSAMGLIGPFTFQTTRSVLALAVLLPFILIKDGVKKKKGTYVKDTKADRKNLITGGILCGLALTVASCFQQFGICYTTASKSGFLTAMYMLMVPVLGIFLKKKIPGKTWIYVAIAVVGMYFLCVKDGFSINVGDVLTLICAFFFSIQIMLVDYYSQLTDGVKLSLMEFLVMVILSGILMLIFEKPSPEAVLSAWIPIVYAGVFSCGIGYTLQILGQKYTEPTVASLIMSLESVFATVGGVILLRQLPNLREWIGIGLMFIAIILSQLPARKSKKCNVL